MKKTLGHLALYLTLPPPLPHHEEDITSLGPLSPPPAPTHVNMAPPLASVASF